MRKTKSRGLGPKLLRGGVSLIALTAMTFVASSAMAQDAPADESEEVVVVGVRKSLKSAQQIKRDADTVVDSITASDIGSFPDKSVAEALQRVAGITVNRFAATTDTAHFSAEPSGVLVRGLNQVRSEFNGRDIFSANSSRGLSWGDISPELMAGVDTYKNQTAELIEGGIAGSINLRTRVPFDSKGRLFAISADISYNDLSEKATPDISGIYSDRWQTSAGEFGVMLNYAYSNVATTSQGIQLGRMGIFCDERFSLTDPTTCKGNQFDHNATDSQHNFAYIPMSMSYSDNDYERTRNGIAFAAQWQDNDKTKLATLQYNSSTYKNQWHERVTQGDFFDLWARPLGHQVSDTTTMTPLAGQQFSFDETGLFQTGLITSSYGWLGGSDAESGTIASNSTGQHMLNTCFSWNGCSPQRRGAGIRTVTRYNDTEQTTSDLSFNFKWDLGEKIKTNFDVQYVEADISNYDINIGTLSFANIQLDMTGEYPTMDLRTPTNVNFAPGGLSNPNSYYYRYINDHIEESDGTEFATRFDVQYDADGGWIDSIKTGVRYAERKQNVQWSNYNWDGMSNTYSCNKGSFNIDNTTPQTWTCPNGEVRTFQGYKPNQYSMQEFGGDLMHGETLITGHNLFPFFNFDILEDRQAMWNHMGQAALSQGATITNGAVVTPNLIGEWVPICARPDEIADSCFTPAEVMSIREQTQAAYVQVKFGGNDKELFGFPVTGNVGVRFVQTKNTSEGGGIKFPEAFTYDQANCDGALTPLQIAEAQAAGLLAIPAPCLVSRSTDDRAFRDGAIRNSSQFPEVVEKTHIHWLPSFNMKLSLSDTWLVRFAASRAMSRPDMGYLRNYFYVTGSQLTQNELYPTNPDIVYGTGGGGTATNCPVGTPCSYKGFRYTAASGNPRLKPTTADQFDITVENYFDQVGSFAFNLFYKQFHDYIQNGTRQEVQVTNNGVTRTVQLTGPVNGEGASIKGFEISYQRFFDFLPAPFDGLGVQANYTHLKNTGIRNTGLATNNANGGGLSSGGGGLNSEYDSIAVDVLEGLSDDAYNLVLMYEKGPWAARAAYNWRSEFLVTAADCCVGFPIWQEAQGFLDGSIRYRVSDNVEVSMQASNILNTDTVLLQQVDNRGTRLPNAWFQNDRRIQFGVRLKY